MVHIPNKQLVLLLCLILNIININNCSESNTQLVNNDGISNTTEGEATDSNVEFTEAEIITDTVAIEAATIKHEQYEDKFVDDVRPMDNLIRSHNYRSSYVGNKPTRFANKNIMIPQIAQPKPSSSVNEKNGDLSLKKRKKKKPLTAFGDEIKYNVGPGVNISVEKDKELVSVYLDEDCLKDVFTGRGRKQDLITKILPLFILPFLIQSAVVPFLVSTLKLLLIKSIVVGKIAIFLLLLSAFKNHVKYAYETSPNPYYADAPNRRSEAITGYRVEGKPTAWIS